MRKAGTHWIHGLVKTALVSIIFIAGATLALSASNTAALSLTETPADALATGSSAANGNLLQNGELNGDYYWKYPNHFVAPGWSRWWVDGSAVPEYYYEDNKCVDDGTNRCRSQRLQRRPETYEAGIYQVVTVTTPCVPYRLTAWSRSEGVNSMIPHVRIGLDPAGTMLVPEGPGSGAMDNPPSPYTAWSAEQVHTFIWEEQTVTAEAAGYHVTAIFYAHPTKAGPLVWDDYYDVFWDAASLVEASFPDDRLPAPTSWQPTGFVTNVTYTLNGTDLTIQWETLQPASTQVWYTIWDAGTPISETQSYSYTVYLPLISRFEPPTAYMTALDVTPTTTHQATIPNVQSGQRLFFAALSRRPGDGVCVTETSPVYDITIGSATSMTLTLDRAADIFSGSIMRR